MFKPASEWRKTFGREISATITPLPGECLRALFRRLSDLLNGASILNMFVFGPAGMSEAGAKAMRLVLGEICWPVTWVEGGACDVNSIAGIQVFAVHAGEVQGIRLNGRCLGSVFEDGDVRHCLLGGLFSAEPLRSRGDQTKQCLEEMDAALAQAGFSIADTVRTWFFLEDILAWYGEFNRARTQTYSGIRFRSQSLPASTGVGGRNPAGAALTLAAWAMQPRHPSARAKEVASPLQCPAPAYGSSFSRAVEYGSAAGRRLLISGTASIAPEGASLWKEEIAHQVEETMRVVEGIVRSQGGALSDLTRATAYFKRRADAKVFLEWCAAHGLLSLPVVLANCDICRDELLFELEAEADLRYPMPLKPHAL